MLNTIKTYSANVDIPKALHCAKKLLQKETNNHQLWFLTTSLYEKTNELDKAYFCVETASNLQPNNYHYRAYQAKLLTHQLGIINISCHALSMAKSIVDQLDIDKISHSETLYIIATVYRKLKEFDRSLYWYNKAAASQPAINYIHNDLGVLHQLYNNNEEAINCLQQAIKNNPQDFMAYWQLSQLSLPDSHAFVNQATNALEKYRDKPEANIYLNYALAKVCEKQKDYERSFRHIDRASRAYRQQFPYDVNADIEYFHRLSKNYPIDSFSPSKNISVNQQQPSPIFIVGLPRTGTTLVEQIICGSSRVSSAGELLHFPRLFEAACRQINPNTEGLDRFQNLEQINHQLLGEMYLNSCKPLSGSSDYFIDKYPFNFILVGAIARALPNAKFVHVRRNPMDACFSNLKHLFRLNSANYSYSLDDLGQYYMAYKQLTDHWQQCLPQQFHTLSYDDLVAEPETTSKGLMSFLDLDWHESLLDFHKSLDAVSTPSAAQVKQKIYRSSQQHWQHYREQLQPLVDFFGKHDIQL